MNPTPWTDKATEEEWFWNKDDVAKLRKLWADPKISASQISAKFEGKYTKNAIIGKARRLKLPARIPGTPKSVIKEEPKPKRKPRPKKPTTVPNKGHLTQVFGSHYGSIPKDPRPLRERAWEPLEGSSTVLIEDHTNGCRWPIGSGPFLYCNNATDKHKYCSVHAEMGRAKT